MLNMTKKITYEHAVTREQFLLIAIRAAVVTGEKEELPDLVQEYRACKANACMRAHKQYKKI